MANTMIVIMFLKNVMYSLILLLEKLLYLVMFKDYVKLGLEIVLRTVLKMVFVNKENVFVKKDLLDLTVVNNVMVYLLLD